jgi:hypothetical protein
MCFGTTDEGLGRIQCATAFDMSLTCRGVYKLRNETQPEERDEHYVKFQRHRLKDQYSISWPQSRLREERCHLLHLLLEGTISSNTVAASVAINNGR